ncbi:MAG: response regulator [Parcubacteria group bacterium CG1_02_39_15]|uniref:Response regulator n=3 Tax=Candidatus Nealsoniibacteriota TaxID=1817911 RepID=A0A2H0MNM1_9BACT|nr:MAG: response regulator [Parcubacteria group bacterium CG1_02_39_15]PIQ98256.1 MAG: response regulator [Candidatus Nealsonbacteria bacterium CG11_big_fil_rev_8_21_14_0_20_39_9]PIW90294.1 MAG: response regulator [Candidatus Nealsonbacteria bacterium CG_4_8_14_3_um_filter_40_11]PIZ88170.1 MAG: response regulator [Candidatus Nealsonbacteria bacterium CG_4_10_14_0_2_um_filter_39_15]
MKSILLVEDDPFLIDIYATKLKESGFSVEVAADGEEGVRKAKENPPSLIVLDIVLPQVDGWEILKEIKAEKKLKAVPVVILSNLGQKSEVEKGIKLGAKKYLIKAHYTPSQVVEEIRQTLNLKP